MSHPTPQRSDQLPARLPVDPRPGIGIAPAKPPVSPLPAVCAITDHPQRLDPRAHAIPPDITDQFGRTWAYGILFGAYRTEPTSGGTWVREARDIHGNAFEFTLAESRAGDLARRVLLELAWDYDQDPNRHLSWPGYHALWDKLDPQRATVTLDEIKQAVLELLILGELSLDSLAIAETQCDLAERCPHVAVYLPAYQAWDVRETGPESPEVAW